MQEKLLEGAAFTDDRSQRLGGHLHHRLVVAELNAPELAGFWDVPLLVQGVRLVCRAEPDGNDHQVRDARAVGEQVTKCDALRAVAVGEHEIQDRSQLGWSTTDLPRLGNRSLSV